MEIELGGDYREATKITSDKKKIKLTIGEKGVTFFTDRITGIEEGELKAFRKKLSFEYRYSYLEFEDMVLTIKLWEHNTL